MRLCIFSRLTPQHRAYAPPVHGLLGKVFRELGHEVTMLTSALPDGTAAVQETDHATVHFLAGTTPGALDRAFWSASARAFDALHAERPFDLVFGRGAATWGFHHGSRAAGTLPVIAHEGTYPLWLHQIERRMPDRAAALSRPIALLRAPLGRKYRECLQRADVVVCNSPALARALRRVYWWNPPATEYIPYGFDLAPWRAEPEGAAPAEPPRIVFVGRLTADKGAFDMVEILARLRHLTARIEAIGPVSDKLAVRLGKLAGERGVSDRLLTPGPERNENLPARLRGAAAFLFPSTHPEGLSKSVMEAMAAALPVVAYRIPGMDVLVRNGETGWLVPPGDPAGVAERLDSLLADPDRAAELGRRGRAVLAEEFSPEAAAARWDALLTATVSRGG